MPLASLALSLLIAARPVAGEEVAPLWITFDVLNPEASGQHAILHLDDLLAGRSDIPGLPSAKRVLLVTTSLSTCTPERGLCAGLSRHLKTVREHGGFVIAVLMDALDELPKAREEVPRAQYPFPVAQDGRSIIRKALALSRPGEAVVVHSGGKITRLSQGLEGETGQRLDEVLEGFIRDLRRAKEAEE